MKYVIMYQDSGEFEVFDTIEKVNNVILERELTPYDVEVMEYKPLNFGIKRTVEWGP